MASGFAALVSTTVMMLLLVVIGQPGGDIAVYAALNFTFWFLFIDSGLMTRIASHFANRS
jgi:hypothetical protein